MSKNRVIYLDVLKILAIIAVIINHSYWYLPGGSMVEFDFKSFVLFVVKWAVPIFLMVSGALLLKKECSYKEIFTKRIFRIIIPLILVTILWTIYKGESLFSIIPNIIRQTNDSIVPYWLWYLYLLIGLYMVTPFLQKMINNFKDKDYKMFLLFFFDSSSYITFC